MIGYIKCIAFVICLGNILNFNIDLIMMFIVYAIDAFVLSIILYNRRATNRVI